MSEKKQHQGAKEQPITLRDPFRQDPFFSSTWDEFDAMRTSMMSQSRDFWTKVDKDLANFDELVRTQHEQMDRDMMTPVLSQMPKWAVPDELKDKWTPALNRQDSRNEVIKVNTTNDKFEVTLNVSDYRPEDLKVTTLNNVLSVEGKTEHQEGDDSASSSVVKQFSRKWTLPTDCRSDDVVSNLSSDGILIVTAPRVPGLTHQQSEHKAIQ